MGTRSLTRIIDSNGDCIINMYRQFDGYPSGHGRDLFDFLDGFNIVNGYNGQEGPKAANGAGCLAAQLVTHFKRRGNESEMLVSLLKQALAEPDGELRKRVTEMVEYKEARLIGSFYLYPASATDCGQDYEYVIRFGEDGHTDTLDNIKVIGYDGVEFDGSLADFGAYVNKEEA